MGNKDIIKQALDKIKEFKKINKKKPTKIYLTLSDEIDLSALPASEVGDEIASQVIENGVREARKELFRCEIIWDSDEFKVE